jgi:hypothetical protein
LTFLGVLGHPPRHGPSYASANRVFSFGISEPPDQSPAAIERSRHSSCSQQKGSSHPIKENLPESGFCALQPVVTAPPAPPLGKKPTKEASIAIEVAGIVVRVETGVNPPGGWRTCWAVKAA